MNTFIATSDGRTIATVSDDVLRGTVVNDLVIACLRNGLQVHYADEPIPEEAAIQISRPKPKLIAAPKRTYKRRVKKTIRPSKASEFDEGNKVYLAWSALNDKLRMEMSQYRMTPGVVEQLRGGQGVQKSIGVRFNSDPELTWLRPAEITRAPDIES